MPGTASVRGLCHMVDAAKFGVSNRSQLTATFSPPAVRVLSDRRGGTTRRRAVR
jgi:hypothetical protein